MSVWKLFVYGVVLLVIDLLIQEIAVRTNFEFGLMPIIGLFLGVAGLVLIIRALLLWVAKLFDRKRP